jgi:hypothetical protein
MSWQLTDKLRTFSPLGALMTMMAGEFFPAPSKASLGLPPTPTSHLTRNRRPVDKEEERASLVGHSTCHKCFISTKRTEHEDTAWDFDPDRLEQLWVAKR